MILSGFLFWEYGCNCAVSSDWKVKMYEVGVLTQLVLTEVEWNCHLNLRCADICFQNVQCRHN